MAYGIGSVIGDIDQKVDTYRNNPEALAQMYQQNQQLIDLLALQKLKTEKEAAMRDMQMKMQTPAASIKDQREQEVMGMMRNEVAQQMGPGLQAAGQQAAQAAAPPAPEGGGLPSLPAPNMQSMGMAEGGIVAFAGERGSYVSQEAPELEKWRAEHKVRGEAARAKGLQGLQALAEMLGIRPTAEVNKELADAIAQRKAGISDFDNDANVAAMFGEKDTATEANVAAMLGENDTANEANVPATPEISDFDNDANVAEMLGENIRRTPPQAGISTVVPQTAPTQAATPEISDAVTEAHVMEMLGGNISPTPPPSVPQDAVKQAPPEVQNEYTRRLSELRGEQESKLEALIAFLQGAGGKTSFAATMSGGAAGMNAREQQIENEIMATVDKIEGLKLEERKMGVQERQASATEEANRIRRDLGYADIESREGEGAADRGVRVSEGAADRGVREREGAADRKVQEQIARYGRISDETIAEMRVKSEAAQRAAVTQDTLTRAQYDNLREVYRYHSAAAQGLLEVANDYTAGEEARLSASKQLQEFKITLNSLETQLRKPLVGNSTSPPAGTGDLNDPDSWGGLNVTAP